MYEKEMPSSITWIDHDSKARDRSLRILALFQERESRDELGLGAIRDSFADQLFPGTSTIQTRLRYTLFVPWMYRRLEEKRVPAAEFAAKARRAELALIEPLLASEDTAGVFGKTAGKGLKRLPSNVYWAGLQKWGILLFPGSQDQYHRAIDQIYQRRQALDEEEEDPMALRGAQTWNRKLPPPPADFTERSDLRVTHEEAVFLQDRIAMGKELKGSLLAHLAVHCAPSGAGFPWEHEELATFPEDQKELLDHARRFSWAMHGAAIIYNIGLARLAGRGEIEAQLRSDYEAWARGIAHDKVLDGWSVGRLWDLTIGKGHDISLPTRRFVQEWLTAVGGGIQGLPDDVGVHNLVKRREQTLKGSRSRYGGGRVLDQWSGKAGLSRMDFRWFRVKQLLKDLHDGLNRSVDA